jgi:hypothetical protein
VKASANQRFKGIICRGIVFHPISRTDGPNRRRQAGERFSIDATGCTTFVIALLLSAQTHIGVK